MALESVSALGYIEIGASDLAAWKQYATAVLGVEVLENQGELLLRYDEEIWRIRVTDSGEDDITCAGFLCESESVLLTVAARLRSLGFDVTGASAEDIARRGVEAMQICHDPAGLRIELYTGSRSAAGRFISPAGVSGFVTGEQGLGHMVLTVPDPDAANRFYMEGLGFLLSDHIYMQTPMGELMLTFLH